MERILLTSCRLAFFFSVLSPSFLRSLPPLNFTHQKTHTLFIVCLVPQHFIIRPSTSFTKEKTDSYLKNGRL